MSIIITQQPTTFLQSSNNDSYFIVSGSTYAMTGITQYKYVGDLYVDDVLSCTLKSFPDPAFGCGNFNIRNIMNSFTSYDWPQQTDGINEYFHQAINSYAEVGINFREEYVSGITFVQPSGVTTSNPFAYLNGSLEFIKSLSVDWSEYLMISGSTHRFLQTKTDYGVNYNRAYPSMRSWLSYYNLSGSVYAVEVDTYDAGLTLLNHYYIANPFQSNDGIQIVASGMYYLSDTVDFTNVAYYDISLTTGSLSGPKCSETVRYKVYENCGKFASYSYNVYWLGEFGEWNAWVFNRKNETSINKTSSTYKKIQGRLNSNGTYTVNSYDSAVNQFYTSLQDSIVMNSDFLSNSDVLYLKGLFTSPKVYIEDVSGTVIGATVKTDSYVINKTVNGIPNKSYSLSITFEPSFNNYGQEL